MSDISGVLEWARIADLTKPLRWGDVETEILRREPADEAQVDLRFRIVLHVRWIALALVGLIVCSPPVVVGLLAVALSDPDSGRTGGLMRPAVVISILECFLLVSLLVAWRSTRRDRNAAPVIVGGFAALASAVTLVVMSLPRWGRC